MVDYLHPLDDNKPNETRVGDTVLQWLSRLHFGRFGGWPIKALWTVLGLVPLLLFITGAIMWWNRVLRPRLQKVREDELAVNEVGVGASSPQM